MNLENVINFFDFKNFDYYYHITGKGIGDLISEEGLLVDGTNLIGAKNIKDTTTIEISRDMVNTIEALTEFVDTEINNSLARDTSEMIIIGSPKAFDKKIVTDYPQKIDEHLYEGLINANMIMGYFNEDLEFIPNPNYAYGTDEFIDSFDDFYKAY